MVQLNQKNQKENVRMPEKMINKCKGVISTGDEGEMSPSFLKIQLHFISFRFISNTQYFLILFTEVVAAL